MPPIKKFQRDEIINITYEIIKNEGLSSVNARRIAKELGGSVQPIYHNFETMDKLNEEVTKKIYEEFESSIKSATDKEKPYLAKGMAYIKYARDYPEFFKILFMKQTDLSPKSFIETDKATSESIISAGQTVFGLSRVDQEDFHVKAWFLAHGIACLLATKTVEMTDKEIYELLGSATRQMMYGFKNNIK